MRLGAAAVDALVQDGQQVVEDSAVGIEQLIEKDELRFGQHAGGDRGDGALAQPHQVHRAEQFVRLSEAHRGVTTLEERLMVATTPVTIAAVD